MGAGHAEGGPAVQGTGEETAEGGQGPEGAFEENMPGGGQELEEAFGKKTAKGGEDAVKTAEENLRGGVPLHPCRGPLPDPEGLPDGEEEEAAAQREPGPAPGRAGPAPQARPEECLQGAERGEGEWKSGGEGVR